jgi:hypothetical protein
VDGWVDSGWTVRGGSGAQKPQLQPHQKQCLTQAPPGGASRKADRPGEQGTLVTPSISHFFSLGWALRLNMRGPARRTVGFLSKSDSAKDLMLTQTPSMSGRNGMATRVGLRASVC